jgi:myo-inositol-1(or 4)-monophosphatase
MPAWGTLIALLRAGEPVFGMMNQPFIRERFSGDGAKAHYRGPAGARDLRVRACAELAEAVLFTTSPLLMNAGDRELFGRVEQTSGCRYGGDCYAYCMLAAGHVDLVIQTGLKPCDVSPGSDHCRRRRCDHHLERRRAQRRQPHVAAGDKRLHAAALEMLRGERVVRTSAEPEVAHTVRQMRSRTSGSKGALES